jgi:hypothetical protein
MDSLTHVLGVERRPPEVEGLTPPVSGTAGIASPSLDPLGKPGGIGPIHHPAVRNGPAQRPEKTPGLAHIRGEDRQPQAS